MTRAKSWTEFKANWKQVWVEFTFVAAACVGIGYVLGKFVL